MNSVWQSAEVFDVIVEPTGADAFTIFAQSMDRTGYARGTLAVQEGLSAAVPEVDKVVYLSMADMGHGAMNHGGAASGAAGHDAHAHEGANDAAAASARRIIRATVRPPLPRQVTPTTRLTIPSRARKAATPITLATSLRRVRSRTTRTTRV